MTNVQQRPANKRPTKGQIAAARLILKRDKEGRGNITITPRIREIAAWGDKSEAG